MLNEPTPSAPTQRGRILGVLIEAHGEWVPGPHIFRLAAQYSARIHELRKLGFRIENKTAKVDGQRHSWFRLVRNQPQEPSQPAVQQPLFAAREG
jgi:hypothetical protein